MATQLFLRDVASDYGTANNDANVAGTGIAWNLKTLSTSRGATAATATRNTVAGPTSGIEVGAGSAYMWYSPPLNADVTISGSITWNLRAGEASNSANASVNGRLEVVDGATGTITLIDQTARTTECSTGEGANNFAETPAAGVACKRGDRLRVRVFADDAAANMGAGFIFTFWYDGPTAAASGDSYLTLTENLTFVSEPAGSQVFPTDTASDVSTASVDREAWTSRGAGVQTDVTNTAAGWTAPIQVTDTAGGTVVDWFTRPLTAFTLGGAVRCNIRALEGSASANAAVRVEIARVAGDGTSPTVWASGAVATELGTSEAAQSLLVAGDDLAITDGQRLRIRFYVDDSAQLSMASGFTVTLYYAGTSGGASGDTYLTFTQTLTEASANKVAVPTAAALTLTGATPTVTVAAPQSAFITEVLADSPTHGWRMGEPSGTLADDAVGSANGTYTGTPTLGATSLIAGDADTAITLTGTANKFVKVATFNDTNYDVWAVEFVFKTASLAAEQTLMARGTNGLYVAVKTNGNIVINKANTSEIVQSNVALTAGSTIWHVIAEKNGATVRIYIQGVDRTGTVTNATLVHNFDELGIYGDRDGTSTLNGTGDDVWYYPAPIGATRAAAHYAALTGAAGNVTAAPTAGALVLAGATPTVVAIQQAQPTAAALVLSGATPLVASPRLAQPTAAALVLTGATPIVLAPRLAQPTSAALVLTGATSVIAAGIRPTVAALVLAGATPTVVAIQQAQPTAGALILTGATPTVVAVYQAQPTAASLVLTGSTPTVTVAAAVIAVPTAAALVLAGATPTVAVTANQVAVPTAATLTFTGATPVVAAGVRPTTGALVLAGATPTVVAIQQAQPTAAALVLTGATPAVSAGANAVAVPTAAALVLTGATPLVLTPVLAQPTTAALVLTATTPIVAAPVLAQPTGATLTFTGAVPVVLTPVLTQPTTAALVLTAATPIVVAGGSTVRLPTAASLVLTASSPVIGSAVLPPSGALALTGATPVVLSPRVTVPTVAALTLTAATPTVAAGGSTVRLPTVAALTLTGSTPVVFVSTPGASVPTPGALVLAGATPTVVAFYKALPTAAVLVLTAATPAIAAGILPTAGTLVLTGATPAIAASARPTAGALVLAGSSPVIGAAVRPTTAALVLTGATPAIAAGANKVAVPTPASLVLTGATPTVIAIANLIAAPTPAALVLTGVTATVAVSDRKIAIPAPGAMVLTGAVPVVSYTLGWTSLPPGGSMTLIPTVPPVVMPVHQRPIAAFLALLGSTPVVIVAGLITDLAAAIVVVHGIAGASIALRINTAAVAVRAAAGAVLSIPSPASTTVVVRAGPSGEVV